MPQIRAFHVSFNGVQNASRLRKNILAAEVEKLLKMLRRLQSGLANGDQEFHLATRLAYERFFGTVADR